MLYLVVAGAFEDPRTSLLIGDGKAYVERLANGTVDVIIMVCSFMLRECVRMFLLVACQNDNHRDDELVYWGGHGT